MSSRVPFPMPEPQRAAAVLIIVEVARAAKVPPAYLTAHIMDSPVMQAIYEARREAQRRILAEVPNCSRGMLARAWGRDLRRMRASELKV
jgi:hypothetical protein